MTSLIMVGLLLLLVVLIANRNSPPRELEPAKHWRAVSRQDYEDLANPSLRRAIKYKLRLLKGLDTVLLVWGARLLTPLLYLNYGSDLIEGHMRQLGESWSIALEVSLMISGIVFAYFVMPAPIPYQRQTRNKLLTTLSISLAILLGAWNILGGYCAFCEGENRGGVSNVR
jgi:hypothetical protein